MLIVIGDELIDEYTEYESIGSDEHSPIVRRVRSWKQPGGAAAVAAMCEALGAEVRLIGTRSCYAPVSAQYRIIIDGTVAYREPTTYTSDLSGPIVRQIRDVKADPSVVLIADYARGAISRPVVEACLLRGWRVVADPHRDTDASAFRDVYGVTPNRSEDDRHGYFDDPAWFPRCCLKIDRDGVVVRDHQDFTAFDSCAIQPPFDTVGAGDECLAAIGVMLSHGHDWREACRIANVAAGLKCEKRGTTPVTLDELTEALRNQDHAAAR